MNWNGKNVLITGANGFVGSYLAKELLDKGSDVYGFIRPEDGHVVIFLLGELREFLKFALKYSKIMSLGVIWYEKFEKNVSIATDAHLPYQAVALIKDIRHA